MYVVENRTGFAGAELIAVAKREQNPRRAHLLVNPLQGKHVPTEPRRTLRLFAQLGRLLARRYGGEKALLIGFAETATAVGAAAAIAFGGGARYLQTSREAAPADRIVDFREEHSHATEQILFCRDWPAYMEGVTRIIFIEDELSTGQTVLNFIHALQRNRRVGVRVKFAVASLTNAMSRERLAQFGREGIECLYLLKIEAEDYAALIAGLPNAAFDTPLVAAADYRVYRAAGCLNPRVGVSARAYESACVRLAEELHRIWGAARRLAGRAVLVLGTEECMYPAIRAGAWLASRSGARAVKTHATTRSPILPSDRPGYPLQRRYALRSVYDEGRQTYLYNLAAYDYALIVTDAAGACGPGFDDLARALHTAGCRDVAFARWEP